MTLAQSKLDDEQTFEFLQKSVQYLKQPSNSSSDEEQEELKENTVYMKLMHEINTKAF